MGGGRDGEGIGGEASSRGSVREERMWWGRVGEGADVGSG